MNKFRDVTCFRRSISSYHFRSITSSSPLITSIQKCNRTWSAIYCQQNMRKQKLFMLSSQENFQFSQDWRSTCLLISYHSSFMSRFTWMSSPMSEFTGSNSPKYTSAVFFNSKACFFHCKNPTTPHQVKT